MMCHIMRSACHNWTHCLLVSERKVLYWSQTRSHQLVRLARSRTFSPFAKSSVLNYILNDFVDQTHTHDSHAFNRNAFSVARILRKNVLLAFNSQSAYWVISYDRGCTLCAAHEAYLIGDARNSHKTTDERKNPIRKERSRI